MSSVKLHEINEPVPDASSILLFRLDNYVQALNIIQDYIESYQSVSKSSIKSYEKVKKSVQTLPRFSRYEGYGVKSSTTSPNNSIKSSDVKEIKRLGSIKSISKSETDNSLGSSEFVRDAMHNVEVNIGTGNGKGTDGVAPNLPHDQGIDGLFEMLRIKIDADIASCNDLDLKIKQKILPPLKELIVEVTNFRKKFSNEADKNSKNLKKIEKQKQKLISELESSVALFTNGSAIDYDKDPFIIKKEFLKNLNEQFENENEVIDTLIVSKEEVFSLEINITIMLKKLMTLFSSYQVDYFGELVKNFSFINSEFSQLNENFEINKFIKNDPVISSNEDLLLLLSSKLPNDSQLVNNNIKRNLNLTYIDDLRLAKILNNTATVPVISSVISYNEEGGINKLKLGHKLKSDYFTLTKSNYLFIYDVKDKIKIDTIDESALSHLKQVREDDVGVTDSNLLSTEPFLKGDVEPEMVFHLPECIYIDSELTPPPSSGLKSRLGTIKSKIGSKKERGTFYELKFVGTDLDHRLFSKIGKKVHKRTITMKFESLAQYETWSTLIKQATLVSKKKEDHKTTVFKDEAAIAAAQTLNEAAEESVPNVSGENIGNSAARRGLSSPNNSFEESVDISPVVKETVFVAPAETTSALVTPELPERNTTETNMDSPVVAAVVTTPELPERYLVLESTHDVAGAGEIHSTPPAYS